MPSTFVNNLRLEEIANGEQTNTWGNTLNTNLELICDALGQGTENLASDANTTITIADGAADGARALYLKITSTSLTATRTVTLAPNTVSKVWFIGNATTGSQSITISQGSGTNVTIPNGKCVCVATDGGGASANVIDVFDKIEAGGPGLSGTQQDEFVRYNANTLTGAIVIPSNKNAMSAGPITIPSGSSLTISANATYNVVGN